MAKKKTGDLYIDVSANVARIQKDMGKITSSIKKSSKKWNSYVRSAKTMLAGFVTVAAIRGIANHTKEIINQADAFAKTGAAIGISTESLSAYAHGAKLAGTNQATLNTGLKMLAKNAEMASRGLGESAKAFKSLGVDVKDSEGNLKSVDDLLKETADAFQGMTNSTERAAKAQQIFGRGGLDMVNFLKDGSAGLRKMRTDADELGITISGKFAKDAEELNDAFVNMGAAASATAITLTSEFAPVISTIAKSFTKAAKEGGFFWGVLKSIGKTVEIGFLGGEEDIKFNTELARLGDIANKAQEGVDAANKSLSRMRATKARMLATVARLNKENKNSNAQYRVLTNLHRSMKPGLDKLSAATVVLREAEAALNAQRQIGIAAATKKRIEAERLLAANKKLAEFEAMKKGQAAENNATNLEEAKLEKTRLAAQAIEAEAEKAKRTALLEELSIYGVKKVDLLTAQYQVEMDLLAGNLSAQKTLTDKYEAEKLELEKKGNGKKRKFTLQHFRAINTATELFAKKGTKIQRTASATNAVINAYEAANVALKSAPPPFGQIMAIATLAAGLKNAKSIMSADSSGATSSPAASVPAAAPTTTTNVNSTSVSANFQGSEFTREHYDKFKQWFSEDFANDRENQVSFQ